MWYVPSYSLIQLPTLPLCSLILTFPLFSLYDPSLSLSILIYICILGVIEFTADEGFAAIPYWMMSELGVDEGGLIYILNVTLPKGTSVTFQPNTYRFAELNNPRAVLERALRGYATLSKSTSSPIFKTIISRYIYLNCVSIIYCYMCLLVIVYNSLLIIFYYRMLL